MVVTALRLNAGTPWGFGVIAVPLAEASRSPDRYVPRTLERSYNLISEKILIVCSISCFSTGRSDSV